MKTYEVEDKNGVRHGIQERDVERFLADTEHSLYEIDTETDKETLIYSPTSGLFMNVVIRERKIPVTVNINTHRIGGEQ